MYEFHPTTREAKKQREDFFTQDNKGTMLAGPIVAKDGRIGIKEENMEGPKSFEEIAADQITRKGREPEDVAAELIGKKDMRIAVAEALFADGDYDEKKRREVMEVIVDSELAAMGIDDQNVAQKVREILLKIALESSEKYDRAKDDEGSRGQVVDDASKPGCDHSVELVSAVTGKEANPLELLNRMGYQDLLAMVAQFIPNLNTGSLDEAEVKSQILALAPDEYIKNKEGGAQLLTVVENITKRDEQVLTKEQERAMTIVTMGIHVSWDAIQPGRSMTDKADLFNQAKTMNPEAALKDEKTKELRIFRGVFSPFRDMVISKYNQEPKASQEQKVARAIVEVLKDMVQVLKYPPQVVKTGIASPQPEVPATAASATG